MWGMPTNTNIILSRANDGLSRRNSIRLGLIRTREYDETLGVHDIDKYKQDKTMSPCI